MAFECGVVPEDQRSAVIVSVYKGTGERTECKNYRGISLLSMRGKIYAGILADRVRRVIGGLVDDEQVGFRAGRCCVDQIVTLKQISEKGRDKKFKVYMGFTDLEKAQGQQGGTMTILRMDDVWLNCWVELRVCIFIVYLVSD